MVTFFALPPALDPRLDKVEVEMADAIFQLNIALAMDSERFSETASSVQAAIDHLQHCFEPVIAAYQRGARGRLADVWVEYCLALRDRDAANDQERPARERMLMHAERRMLEQREPLSQLVARVWSDEIRDLVKGLRQLVTRINAVLPTDQRCAA